MADRKAITLYSTGDGANKALEVDFDTNTSYGGFPQNPVANYFLGQRNQVGWDGTYAYALASPSWVNNGPYFLYRLDPVAQTWAARNGGNSIAGAVAGGMCFDGKYLWFSIDANVYYYNPTTDVVALATGTMANFSGISAGSMCYDGDHSVYAIQVGPSYGFHSNPWPVAKIDTKTQVVTQSYGQAGDLPDQSTLYIMFIAGKVVLVCDAHEVFVGVDAAGTITWTKTTVAAVGAGQGSNNPSHGVKCDTNKWWDSTTNKVITLDDFSSVDGPGAAGYAFAYEGSAGPPGPSGPNQTWNYYPGL